MRWRAGSVPLFYTLLFCTFFAPVLFTGRLLAPGDATIFYLPAFRSSHALWETQIGAGFPLAADGGSQRFYPLAAVASALGWWNALVVAAYVIAASATFGLVFELTRCAIGSLLSGLIVGMSAYLIIHLPHLTYIHAVAWVPLMLWAFERLRRRRSPWWCLVAALAVALGAVAGHPQPFVYGLSLAVAYAIVMGFDAPSGRWWYATTVAGAACLGLGMAAVQWVPMLELGRLSHRPRLDFAEFVSFSLPARQAAQIFFPFLFGGASLPGPYAPAYHGQWNLGELAGYVGFLPWTAAVIAVLRHEQRRLVWFWCAVAVASFLLALGDDTPLAGLIYPLAPYNRFRCPSRHLMETTLAVAILCGLGVAALRQKVDRGGRLAGRVSVAVIGAAAVLLALSLFGPRLVTTAEAWTLMAESLHRPAVFVPLSFAALAVPTVVLFARNPASTSRAIALAVVTTLDLASFAWFVDWRVQAPEPQTLSEPSWLTAYASRLHAENQRLATFYPATAQSTMPNLTWMWGVPNASGHSQLVVGRHRDLLPILNGFSSFCPRNRALDLLAVRYAPRPRVRGFGFEWEVGSDEGCGDGAGARHAWALPDLPANRVGIVASLGNSVAISDGAQVATLEVETASGAIRLPIRAGEHVSDWAYDRADVRSRVRHRRARVFESWTAMDEHGRAFLAHRYVLELDLGGLHHVRRIEVKPEPGVSLRLGHVSTAGDRGSLPVVSGLLDSERWRPVEVTDAVRVYENLRAMPRAWLVDETLELDPPAILRAIHTSRLPDGRDFDPRATALLEDALELSPGVRDPVGDVVGVRIEDESVEVRTRAPGARFLVLSDVYYPGWRATIDGAPARVYPTDYALRGVALPAGEHLVRFDFRPTSFYVALAISVASLILAGFFALRRGGF